MPFWHTRGLIACLLLPVSLLFALLVSLRRGLYRFGILRVENLPVPVVVVGNISVGGSGKTPLTLMLAQTLAARGRRPGIVMRGYRGAVTEVRAVHAHDTAAQVGDEALLLARRGVAPVFVGPDRVAAARSLLRAYPECDVILADDGLQHYRLGRTVEIVVIDRRLPMNGWMLPAGPLREGLGRLRAVDALVRNGEACLSVAGVPSFTMRLAGSRFVLVSDSRISCVASELAGRRLHAVAGIGEPERFFEHLRGLGLTFEAHAFPDHHAYTVAELDFTGDAILSTEKDAVKLAAIAGLRLPVWQLPVDALVEPDLAEFLLEKLDGRPSA
jgi:tetraacyldisaccharide 4'-kinase